MSRYQAEKAAREMMSSGYRHHTYEEERTAYSRMFQFEREAFIEMIQSPQVDDMLMRYAEILAPTHIRALKNTIICLISAVCRAAIDEGVDVEFSFALSDYYINQLEMTLTEQKLRQLTREIMLHYYDLVQNEKRQDYTKPVASAVRYIGRNLYGVCPVSAVAEHVGLEPHYFSALFSRQVGISPGRYIMQRKLEEARRMLMQLGATVTDTAESLGFCDAAHFSRCFKKAYGFSPSVMSRRDMPRIAK